ncbi:MAG: type IA DNA topoisomerase [Lachnospiraceae bacterium]|nr:type IA DNA topoisomerase [Lachnospiraceae bacterium]
MAKSVFIAEKPSVAKEFAKALNQNLQSRDGYLESENYLVTWCVGHLVTMSYPEKYDPSLKKWNLSTLPFLPNQFIYEVIPQVAKQFRIVEGILNREDVDTIYVCTDSGREGEYIYRLVEQQAKVQGKNRKRVWIDSQTEAEIHRGIEEAKSLTEYDNLADSAFLRAKEDYLMGINFSRLLTLKYGNDISKFLNEKYTVISVGRVMTCVLGMVVNREREIRSFQVQPFYRVLDQLDIFGRKVDGEWKAVTGSAYFESPKLYKENGFRLEEDANRLVDDLKQVQPFEAIVQKVEQKKETKNPPLLYNLAEIQNDCSKLFKISPDETLKIVQELYEKKMVTYPRTDARVLSTAVAKEITTNLKGIMQLNVVKESVSKILEEGSYKNISKTRYVNDKQITDHYAIIPTGQGIQELAKLKPLSAKIYEIIVRRFIAIFLPPAIYKKITMDVCIGAEHFFSNMKVLQDPGYLSIMTYTFAKKDKTEVDDGAETEKEEDSEEVEMDESFLNQLATIKKGTPFPIIQIQVKAGETSPPKRYNSGTLILAMENAGQLIEDEELRIQIKGSGIGTSATRAEIQKKLVNIQYLNLNKKTQIITPTLLGECIYEVVGASIFSLLNPKLTASWEMGLTQVADGSITSEEYMEKLETFINKHTDQVKTNYYGPALQHNFHELKKIYGTKGGKK